MGKDLSITKNLFYLHTENVLLLFIQVHPLSYFSFQPMLHDLCNKGRGMCYPVCGIVHINVAAAGFLSRYLSGPLPYV